MTNWIRGNIASQPNINKNATKHQNMFQNISKHLLQLENILKHFELQVLDNRRAFSNHSRQRLQCSTASWVPHFYSSGSVNAVLGAPIRNSEPEKHGKKCFQSVANVCK